jgi:hypothetical protein
VILSTQLWTWARALINAGLLAYGARPAGALLTTPTLRLATVIVTPTPDSDPTAFTEASFTGYAGVTLTLGTAGLNITPTVQGLVQSGLFEMTALTAGVQSVVAVYMTDAGATVLYGYEVLADQVNFNNPGDFLDYNLILPASVSVPTA